MPNIFFYYHATILQNKNFQLYLCIIQSCRWIKFNCLAGYEKHIMLQNNSKKSRSSYDIDWTNADKNLFFTTWPAGLFTFNYWKTIYIKQCWWDSREAKKETKTHLHNLWDKIIWTKKDCITRKIKARP
jgi:hypothetical protein